MTDEIKAAAERMTGLHVGYVDIENAPDAAIRDAFTLAKAYLAHLDREADRAKPVTVEWLESIGLSSRIAIPSRNPAFDQGYVEISQSMQVRIVTSVGCSCGCNLEMDIDLPHITTRGQVMDLCGLIGFKLGWHLEGKVKP